MVSLLIKTLLVETLSYFEIICVLFISAMNIGTTDLQHFIAVLMALSSVSQSKISLVISCYMSHAFHQQTLVSQF